MAYNFWATFWNPAVDNSQVISMYHLLTITKIEVVEQIILHLESVNLLKTKYSNMDNILQRIDICINNI